jgi:hypothetical protein
MKPRAALHQSAPIAIVRAMSKALVMRPAAPTRRLPRRSRPTSVLCTSISASCIGTPTWSMNSAGAAPVPPSAPSTTMKSGRIPVSCIALAIPNHSHGCPIASLNPVGLPPLASRSRATNWSSPIGVLNVLCCAGDTQSTPIGTPRVTEISALTFAAGSTPPWPGLAPCDSLISIILTCGSRALAMNRSRSNPPFSSRQPK